jgi:drug/metabolite transporter (DMT)-like permease
MKVFMLTTLAMIAFAANSLLCRMALGDSAIDPASFTTLRLGSGAFVLWLITALRRPAATTRHRDLLSAGFLFAYAILFSFAYISLSTGTGALILFGAVQVTMILTGLIRGERPHWLAWIGIVAAMGGMVYLVSPGISAPPLTGAVLMAMAGIAWGGYSLKGKRATDPIAATTSNFIYTLPLTLAVSAIMITDMQLSTQGILLALMSGGAASGIGYVIWYAALPHLSPTPAASVQLSVPLIAAFGGVIVLDEVLTWRLIVAGLLILGGIALVVLARKTKAAPAIDVKGQARAHQD